jgi:hypothetical protein
MKETYQMEPRNVRNNTFKTGITEEEHYGTNPMENTGVPLQGFKGVPVVDDHGAFGVPMPGASYDRDPKAAPTCLSITKAGNLCKAAPIQGTNICVGHQRAEQSG